MAEEIHEEMKVDKWNGTAVKNALDDVIRKIFIEDLEFSVKNLYTDIRLLLSMLCCAFALHALLYDYLHPFPASKSVLTVCVLTYFVLMSILTLFMTFVEKNIILVCRQREASGLDPDSEWSIQTTLKRFDNMFTVEISRLDGNTQKKTHGSFVKCVSSWVNVDGVVLVDKLKEDVMASHQMLVSGKKDQ